MRILLILLLTLNLLNAKKIALLIGNSNYQKISTLSSPSKDIPALAKKLKGMGFEVVTEYNLDRVSMYKALDNFQSRLRKNSGAIGFFYYSGHGSQAKGDSYLIPVEVGTEDENSIIYQAIKVEEIANRMASSSTKANILFLDACRDVPTGTMGNGTKGLGHVKNRPSGSLIVYSTQAGKTARDNRLFNQVVLEKLALNQSILLLANDISLSVKAQSREREKQIPEVFTSAMPNIVLVDGGGYVPPTIISKWITPTNSVCTNNGGKLYKGICNTTWKNATEICRASGGKLPSREDLHKVIRDCGGIADASADEYDKNKNNSHYQSCYKQRGFSDKDWYWTREEKDSSNAWDVNFYGGNDNWNSKTYHDYALCVR